MLSEYKLLLLSLVLVLVTHTASFFLIHGVSKLRVILLGSDSVEQTQ